MTRLHESPASPRLTAPPAGRERRRRFVVLECPYCGGEHDVLLDGGRQTAPCGRIMEASAADPSSASSSTAEGRVWGLEPEGSTPLRARLSF